MSLLFTAHPVCVEFFNLSSNGSARTLGCNNSVNGVALHSLLYPNDTCAHAYNATVLNCTDDAGTVQNIVNSPVRLTVGQSDELVSAPIISLTSTTREIEYFFRDTGRDLSLGGRRVDVKVNDTEFACTTDPAWGIAEFTRDFPAINGNLTTYVITASFAGDNPISASANSTLLDGSIHAVCATAQHNGYEP